MLFINYKDSMPLEEQSKIISELKENLKNNTLNPVFELYGNFVNRAPKWIYPESSERFKGCTSIFGNFLTLSHVFHIMTDDEQLIGELEELVAENKKRPEYQTAKAEIYGQITA